MESTIAKHVVNDELQGMKNKMGKLAGQKQKIDWNDFNWPPLLKIFHFNLEEQSEDPELQKYVKLLRISHVVLFGLTILNFISNIAQVSSGESGLRLFYSFLYIGVFNPIHTYWFYAGYRGRVEEPSLLRHFKCGSYALVIIYFVFSIWNQLCWNGWVRVGQLFSTGQGFAGVIGLIESFALSGMVGFIIWCLYRLHKHENPV